MKPYIPCYSIDLLENNQKYLLNAWWLDEQWTVHTQRTFQKERDLQNPSHQPFVYIIHWRGLPKHTESMASLLSRSLRLMIG